jgi:hypothetical protein
MMKITDCNTHTWQLTRSIIIFGIHARCRSY